MSGRRRAGTWQDEVARGFSRLFSRGSSQEEDAEEPDRSNPDTGPPSRPETEPSPSRLFFRRATDSQPPARSFSRLFSRSSSQEDPEGGHPDTDRYKEKNGNVNSAAQERLTPSLPEQVKEDQNSLPPCQVSSESEEEKDKDVSQNSKVFDSEKQSRENFFNFLGNLFHFSPKTSSNAKQADSARDPGKEHEDAQVKNNLDEEESHQEQTQDVSISGTSELTEQTGQAQSSMDSNMETDKEVIEEEQQDIPPSKPKINGYHLEAPAVTYGTYRGSRKIRKLLRRRPDNNSPIPEKEENSEKETNSTGDVGTDDLTEMYMELDSFEISSTKVHVKDKVPSQTGELNLHEFKALNQNSEDSQMISRSPGPNSIETSNILDNLQSSTLDISKISENLALNVERSSNASVDLPLDNDDSSRIDIDLQPKKRSSISEDLHLSIETKSSSSEEPYAEKYFNISSDLQTNSEKSLDILELNSEPKIGSSMSAFFDQKSNISVDTSLHTEDSKCVESVVISSDLQASKENIQEFSEGLQPNAEESLHNSDGLQTHFERMSNRSEALLLPKEDIISDLQPILRNSLNSLESPQPNTEKCCLADLQLTNASVDLSLHTECVTIASSNLQPIPNSPTILERAKPNAEECLNHSEDLQTKVETNTSTTVDLSMHDKNITEFCSELQSIPENITHFSDSLKPNNSEALQTYVEKTSNTSVESSLHESDAESSSYLPPNISNSLNPNVTKCLNNEEHLKTDAKKSDTLVDPSLPKQACTDVSSGLIPFSEEKNSEDLQPNAAEGLRKSNAQETNVDKKSKTSVHSNDISTNAQLNFKNSSDILDSLKPNGDKCLNWSNDLQTNIENISCTSVDLSLGKEDSTETSSHLQLNNSTDIIKHIEPNVKMNLTSSEYLSTKLENISNRSIDPLGCKEHHTHISSDLQLDPEKGSDILQEQQVNADESLSNVETLQTNVEKGSNLSVDPSFNNKVNSEMSVNAQANSEKPLQQNSGDILPISGDQQEKESSKILDLQPNFGNTSTVSESLQSTEESLKSLCELQTLPTDSTSNKISENTSMLQNPSLADNTTTNIDNMLAPDKGLNFNSGNKLNNQQKVTGEEVQLCHEEHLSTTQIHLMPQVTQPISEEFHQNVQKILQHDRRPDSHVAKDLQQNIEESLKHKEFSADLVSVNSETQSEEIGYAGQRVALVGIGAEELESAKMLEDNKACSIGIGRSTVETSNSLINKCNLPSSSEYNNTDRMSKTVSVNGNFQDAVVVHVKPLLENNLSNVLSNDENHMLSTVRTISFDNGIECHSPPTTISGSPSSPNECIDIRYDSPLPDAIDSGIVSAQATTPEEHIPVKTFSSEIFSKNISDSFDVEQDSKENSTETEMGNMDNTMQSPYLLDDVLKLRNVSPIKETERLGDANDLPKVESVSFKHSCLADVGDNLPGRHSINGKSKVNMNPDIYVAKVSVKSVNIEEVKLSPYAFHSDIISISKVESPQFEKEIISLPNSSSPPPEAKWDNGFKDLQQNIEGDTNTEKDAEIIVANDNKPSQFLDSTKYNKPTHYYMEDTKFPSINMKNEVVLDDVDMFPAGYISEEIPQYTFLERGLPKISNKSPDVLIENLKNNNLTTDTSDDIINISLQTATSDSELANESLLYNDSLWELRSSDSLTEFHPDEDVTHKEQRKSGHAILHSTLQSDVNLTDDMNSSGSASPKMILSSIELSESSDDLFEEKANEIIFSVLHSAIEEFQNINKNTIHAVQEKIIENNLLHSVEDHFTTDDTEPSDTCFSLSMDAAVSKAEEIVNDVLSSSKQSMQNSLDKDADINLSSTRTSVDVVNGQDKDTKHLQQNASLLAIHNAVPHNLYNVRSNVQPSTEILGNTTSDQTIDPAEGSIGSNDLKMTEDTKKSMQCFRDIQEKEANNIVNGRVDSYLNLDAKIQGAMENNVSLGLSFYAEQEDSSSKSLETEGSMFWPSTKNSNILTEGSKNTSGTEPDPFQFTVYSSKYVEIESDDESTDEDSAGNEGIRSTDSFLSQSSRRVKIYPFSLSPIYEDDSSGEDTMSCKSSPRHKEGTTASSANDHTSILSLLQSVSDRLMEANMDEMDSGEKVTALSDVTTFNDMANKDGSVLEDRFASTKLNLDIQKVLEEEKTSGGKKSGLFITKAENRWNPVAARQSFLLNLGIQSAVGEKSSLGTNSTSSPSPTNESTLISYKDLSPNDAADNAHSPIKVVADSGLSARKSETEYKPRLSSNSIYYQYFNSSKNYPHGTENKESPTEEKLDLPTEKEQKETKHPEMNGVNSESLRVNPRPGKVILSDIIHHDNTIELKGDILDATSWKFPNGVNIRVIKGCWILYEKPHFEGQAHVLEEGEAELLHLWDPPGARSNPEKISIGSVKRVMKDYLPEVVISSLQDSLDTPVHIRAEVSSLENLVDKRPRSLTVNSGVWLAYTEPQYSGTVSALEEGSTLPCIQEGDIKSMRPLKMGGLKVQQPNDPKIIIYEKPHFQGWSREITEHVSSIGKLVCDNNDRHDIGSVQVVGGIWVGYENERYKGHQYLLEEGEYEDWQAWGGYSSTLQSIRYLQTNFLEASVTLFESESEEDKHVDLFNQAIPDLELAGHNTRTQCIHVKKGVWVAYQQKHYCGEQYILEKGRYKSYVDWGGSKNTIMSIRPVLLEPLGRNEVKHLIKMYENTNFQGQSAAFTEEASDFTSFMPKSCKVLRGCWLLGYKADTCDNVFVLEEGQFPDLASHGCSAAVIKFLRPIDYVFAEPSISLFALDSCEGRELHFEEAVTSVLSEDLHFYAQSVWVRRGLWIAFEGTNFLGRQMLLDSQKISNWSQFSSWKAIGSLRPLKQPAVYFMLRNRHKDKYLTVTGKAADTRATFVSISSRNGQNTQIWYFSRGFLKSKANDSCLDVIGGKNIPGSKVSLWAEHGKPRQKWKINNDGTVSSYISDDLVLDLKGGNYYDQNYLVVNRAQDSALTQKWDIEIL